MSDRPIILKSFDYNVTIVEISGTLPFLVECKTASEFNRISIDHRRFAFYNHFGLKNFPKNEWVVFLFSSPYIMIPDGAGPSNFKIYYKYVTSQKDEPNPQQVTLLRNLALIL